ncbi:TRAP transporter substrate-binding protein [Pararhizobium mangrovi]|uniref:TRAP transporter substrate-binding protein n=1 Tax=Pararhizobium mangrovi TaxID=2590452 RepID=A0A506UB84_9HYPH|nr:TRAP transporter substrate-binding protein [Pararhizobium mangrovi]TPW29879.1 TRAP transporter substrate-binding protein [Pararhizobium mangrovi]
MKFSSVLRGAILASAAFGVLAAGPASAATNWRGWNIHAPGYPNTVALEDFAKNVGKKTDGDITAQVYNNAVLGDQTDAIEQVRNGAIDFANFNMGPMGQYVPMTNVLSLPFLFSSVDQMHHVMDGKIGQKFSDALSKKGLVALSWFDSGARSMYNNEHPITKPSDVKGLKVRVMDNDLYVDMIDAMGGNATPMPFGDVYQSLKSGVIDGAENNYPSYKETNHYEVAKYYSTTDHLIIPECLCVATKSWNALSDKDKKIVRQAAVDAAKEQRKLWAKDSEDAEKFVESHGATVNQIKDLTPFQNAMKPVYDKFYKNHPDMKSLVQEIRSTK